MWYELPSLMNLTYDVTNSATHIVSNLLGSLTGTKRMSPTLWTYVPLRIEAAMDVASLLSCDLLIYCWIANRLAPSQEEAGTVALVAGTMVPLAINRWSLSRRKCPVGTMCTDGNRRHNRRHEFPKRVQA